MWSSLHILHNQTCEEVHAENKECCDQRVAWHYLCARSCVKLTTHAENKILHVLSAPDHPPIGDQAPTSKPSVLRGVLQRFHRHSTRRDSTSACDRTVWASTKAEWASLCSEERDGWLALHESQLQSELSAARSFDVHCSQVEAPPQIGCGGI